jgi:hypothetical protein
VLGIEFRALPMLGKCSTTWTTSPTLLVFNFVFKIGVSLLFPRLAYNSRSFCLYLLGNRDYRSEPPCLAINHSSQSYSMLFWFSSATSITIHIPLPPASSSPQPILALLDSSSAHWFSHPHTLSVVWFFIVSTVSHVLITPAQTFLSPLIHIS